MFIWPFHNGSNPEAWHIHHQALCTFPCHDQRKQVFCRVHHYSFLRDLNATVSICVFTSQLAVVAPSAFAVFSIRVLHIPHAPHTLKVSVFSEVVFVCSFVWQVVLVHSATAINVTRTIFNVFIVK